MKKSMFVLMALMMLTFTSNAQSKLEKVTFKVYGNCGMCKSKIEGAVNEQEGVKSAEWSVKSKKMAISYNPSKITLDQLKQLIADAGYDSESHRASDGKYKSLHGCCQYKRPE